MLERLVTPLEHMLRNAIDHGLEDRAQREQAQKPETDVLNSIFIVKVQML